MDKLKPCPWVSVRKDIGHDLRIDEINGFLFVQCTCGARGPILSTSDSAIKAWNTRPKCSTCKFLHENKKWDSGYECTNNKACNSGVGVAALKTFGCIYHEKGE